MSQPAAKLDASRAFNIVPEALALRFPGLALALVVAIAATFLSERFKLSAMVFALLLGMAFNFVMSDARYRPGIESASRIVLRTGVALLGLRITLGEVASLGWGAVIVALLGIVLTVGLGLVAARRLGLGERFGVLSGGAVSICGASAALAISSVLPKHSNTERDASFVVVTVTALSTVAMFLYPVVAGLAGFDDRAAGVFFGATIHDVAQVVGAGYSVSDEAGNMATIMKLLRVSMLLPVCFVIGMVLHVRGGTAKRAAPVLPWFVAVFGALVIVGSLGWLPPASIDLGNTASRWFLVIAMAAIGMKTTFRGLVSVGPRAVLLVVVETAFLAMLMLAIAWAIGRPAGF